MLTLFFFRLVVRSKVQSDRGCRCGSLLISVNRINNLKILDVDSNIR